MQQERINLNLEQQPYISSHSEVVNQDLDKSQGRWNQDQHTRFLEGLFKYGKNWKQIETLVSTRTCSQVRSHAQKYFLKLLKILKDRKKQKNKSSIEISPLENQILERFTKQDITEKTPEIIVSLLQNESLLPRPRNVQQLDVRQQQGEIVKEKHLKNLFKKKKQKNQQINADFPPEKELTGKIKSQQTQKNQNIIELYGNQQYQDKSFFQQLMQNNAEHFRQGRNFSDFIDIVTKGNEETQNKNQQLDSAETTRNRRSSFTLVDDLQNDQKLKLAIQKIKNGRSSS